jgi:hypothetical protein
VMVGFILDLEALRRESAVQLRSDDILYRHRG